jgi:hypothetical protein
MERDYAQLVVGKIRMSDDEVITCDICGEETADADRSNNVYAGRIEPVMLGIDKPEDAKNRMKDSDRKILPGSLQTYEAPASK